MDCYSGSRLIITMDQLWNFVLIHRSAGISASGRLKYGRQVHSRFFSQGIGLCDHQHIHSSNDIVYQLRNAAASAWSYIDRSSNHAEYIPHCLKYFLIAPAMIARVPASAAGVPPLIGASRSFIWCSSQKSMIASSTSVPGGRRRA